MKFCSDFDPFLEIVDNNAVLQFDDIKEHLTACNRTIFKIDDNAQMTIWPFAMANFYPLFKDFLEIYRPRSICEVGMGDGFTTKLLVQIAKKYSAELYLVDTTINYSTLGISYKGAHFFQEKSDIFFKRGIKSDLYFIDAEHTYDALMMDLKTIYSMQQNRRTIIFLHDMSFPHSYRDVIYSWIDYLHKDRKTKKGHISFNNDTISDFGLPMFYADNVCYEGGEKNGLLKAVENFLVDSPWTFTKINSLFGFGMLYNPKVCTQEELDWLLQYKSSTEKISPFLDYLEMIRLLLHMKISRLESKNHNLENQIKKLQQNRVTRLLRFLKIKE